MHGDDSVAPSKLIVLERPEDDLVASLHTASCGVEAQIWIFHGVDDFPFGVILEELVGLRLVSATPSDDSVSSCYSIFSIQAPLAAHLEPDAGIFCELQRLVGSCLAVPEHNTSPSLHFSLDVEMEVRLRLYLDVPVGIDNEELIGR